MGISIYWEGIMPGWQKYKQSKSVDESYFFVFILRNIEGYYTYEINEGWLLTHISKEQMTLAIII